MTLFNSDISASPTNSHERFREYFPGRLLPPVGEVCTRTATLAAELAELEVPAIDLNEANLVGFGPVGVEETSSFLTTLMPDADVVDLFTRERL